MNAEEARLEALKLAHRHDKDPGQVVDIAKVFEEYLLGTVPMVEAPKQKRKAGNPE